MIQPLDLQLAWKAVPIQGDIVLQQQASSLYRTMQDLKDSHQRNLTHSQKVTQLAEGQTKLFLPLSNADLLPNTYPKQLKDRYKAKHKQQYEYEIYGSVSSMGKGKHKNNLPKGSFLDLVA